MSAFGSCVDEEGFLSWFFLSFGIFSTPKTWSAGWAPGAAAFSSSTSPRCNEDWSSRWSSFASVPSPGPTLLRITSLAKVVSPPRRPAQGLGDVFDGARRLESSVIVLPVSVLTKISVDSEPLPLRFPEPFRFTEVFMPTPTRPLTKDCVSQARVPQAATSNPQQRHIRIQTKKKVFYDETTTALQTSV
jgi:hypothetical protein